MVQHIPYSILLKEREVTGEVQNCLNTQLKNFFSDGIEKLVEHWNRCVEVEGDYIEK
jgi:hypothetical protein